MTKKLDGRIAIITGASSGLGRASAELFAQHGAKVIIADIQDEAGRNVADQIGGEYVRTDVSDAAQITAVIQHAVTKYGKLDIMYNNAGFAYDSPVVDTPDNVYHRIIAVNLNGAFFGIRAAAQTMTQQGFGTIITTASNGGSSATARQGPYCATKAAVIALSKATAYELAPIGIRVNTISPGAMLTGMTAGLDAETLKLLDRLQPMGRPANPMEMAYGALYLASDDASYVTGHDLIVDGGGTAARRSTMES